MTEFTKNECFRLIDKLTETDPTTEAYHILLSSIERFDAIGQTIDEVAGLREKAMCNVVPFTAPDFPEEVKEEIAKAASDTVIASAEEALAEFDEKLPAADPEPVKEETYTSSQVRKALVDARKSGVDVKALLAEFDADNFSAVPASKYGAIMHRLGA